MARLRTGPHAAGDSRPRLAPASASASGSTVTPGSETYACEHRHGADRAMVHAAVAAARRTCAISARRRRSPPRTWCSRSSSSKGLGETEPIPGLDGNCRLGLDAALDVIAADVAAGVRHFLLFAVPSPSSAAGYGAFAAHGRRRDQARVRRRPAPVGRHLLVLEHRRRPLRDLAGRIARSISTPRWPRSRQMTLRVADAGADGVSPSDMMDGRTARLRAALDEGGHAAVPIMSYSTKFASRFYGPFRTAAGSAPKHGTREHYQIDVRSRTDAIAIERALRERGRRSADGEARHDVARSDRADPRSHRQAGRRLSGERRVRRPVRARPRRPRGFRRGAARDLARVPPRRRRLHHHLRRAPRARRWECRRDRSRRVVRARRSRSRRAACRARCAHFDRSAACRSSSSARRGSDARST